MNLIVRNEAKQAAPERYEVRVRRLIAQYDMEAMSDDELKAIDRGHEAFDAASYLLRVRKGTNRNYTGAWIN